MILDNFPDIMNKDPASVFYRYVVSHQEEVDYINDELDSIIAARQIDRAEDDQLDRIGKFFGSVGRRAGRDDPQYREYLKSIVPIFTGRGTKPAIREAVAGALGVDMEDVGLLEDFENVEYDIELYDWGPHETITVEDVADMADPSGVKHDKTRYNIIPEPTITSDDAWMSEEIWVAWDTADWDEMHWSSSEDFRFGYGISPYGTSYGDPIDIFPGAEGYQGSEYTSSPYGS